MPSEPATLKRILSLLSSIRRILSSYTGGVFPMSVKRIIKVTLIAIVAAAGLVGLALLAINLYVQSPGSQQTLREIVSENLGYPVSVFRISFTPWNGFHFQDVTIQNPAVDYPFLRAQDLWIQCNYLPLFRRKLIVRQVYLSGAEFRIPTTARLEAETETDNLPPKVESVPQPESSKEPASTATPGAAISQPGKVSRAENRLPGNLWVEIRKFKIRYGTIYFLGPAGVPTATLRDIEGSVQSHKGGYVGKVRISSAALSDSINVEEISSPVHCFNGALDLPDITAQEVGASGISALIRERGRTLG